MQINIRNDSVVVTGYVNAVERKSKPLRSRMGQFVERICKGAFTNAIARNDDIRLLLNHDWKRDLAGTKDGTLELVENNIGLKARATITDKEVIEKARNGELVGWSFGFRDRDVQQHEENGMPTRDVKDLDLYEVSLLDKTRNPAYEGTLVSVRAEDDIQYHSEPFIDDLEVREETVEQPEDVETTIDYSKYEALIDEMKEDL